MAVPRIFISSTCYDLKYIRENLKYFVNNLGYESILSEDGDIFYNPDEHTHDSCLNEVKNCQIFVLIIGGRFGGKYLNGEKSITNKEYEEAVKLKIPVFTLIEKNVLSEHFVYQKNKNNLNADKIIYPNVDDTKIFLFIDEVRKSNYNNAIYPFSDFRDIENYLKKQWAGMMYSFLTDNIETKKVASLFEEIHSATDKIEYYTKQVALNVGDKLTNILIKCYEKIAGDETVQNLKEIWKIKVNPYTIVQYECLDDICNQNISVQFEDDSNSIGYGGPPYVCSRVRYNQLSQGYIKMREKILSILKEDNYEIKEFLNHMDDHLN